MLIFEQTTSSTRASSSTTAKVRPGTGGYSDPYAEDHGIYYDQYGGTITDYTTKTNYTTTYRTTTTTTTTSKWFEQYEAGMDGWDMELGFKLPLPIGPEVRLFGGYYSYDNPFGDDVDGLKARLEIKTGPYLALDAEIFEDETLNGSDFFVGARLQIPLSRDLSWNKFVDGLVSMEHRSLDERMRSEMVQRDVRIQSSESDWQENLAKRAVDVQSTVSTRTSKHSKTTVKSVQDGTPGEKTKITLADKITFVDKDNAADTSQDGTNEHPYGDDKGGIQKAVDNAGENTTIFVYEAGGQVNGISQDSSDMGGVYDEQVTMRPGQIITSEIIFSGHPTQTSYATVNRPLIKPSTVTYDKKYDTGWEIFEYAAAVTMPENSALQRMAVETSQDKTSAVWVQPQLGSGSVRIDRSVLRTSGPDADGLTAELDNASLENLTVSGSTISTTGEYAHGIGLWKENNASLNSLNVSGSTISTAGYYAHGISTDISSSSLGSLNVSETFISTTGDYAHGMSAYIYSSILDSLNVNDTSISTAGEGGYGISTALSQANLGSLNVNVVNISTSGEFARGLHTNIWESNLDSLSITDSTISTANDWATALDISAYSSSGSSILDNLSISNNSIVTTGQGASGLHMDLTSYGGSVYWGNLNVAGNSISTASDYASALWMTSWASASEGGSLIVGSLTIAENTLNAVGDLAGGVDLFFGKSTNPMNPNPIDSIFRLDSQAIQDNAITAQGTFAYGIRINGSSIVLPSPAFNAAALEAGNTIEVSGPGAEKVTINP